MYIDTPIIITYQVRLNDDLENGTIIENSGDLGVGFGIPYTIYAEDVTVVVFRQYLPLVMNE